MAYLIDYKKSCDHCAHRKAKKGLMNRYNILLGYFCKRCAKYMLMLEKEHEHALTVNNLSHR